MVAPPCLPIIPLEAYPPLLTTGPFGVAAMQEFSEVVAVSSRNSLYQILAINVALGRVSGLNRARHAPIGAGV